MANIISIQDHLLANETPDITKEMPDLANEMPEDNQSYLALENQQLSFVVTNLESSLYNQRVLSANLKGQIKELQIENDTLLNVLEEDNAEALSMILTDAIAPRSKQKAASQSLYWEREYSQLKDKIRHLEQLMTEKDDVLKQVTQENEMLLNEVLTK